MQIGSCDEFMDLSEYGLRDNHNTQTPTAISCNDAEQSELRKSTTTNTKAKPCDLNGMQLSRHMMKKTHQLKTYSMFPGCNSNKRNATKSTITNSGDVQKTGSTQSVICKCDQILIETTATLRCEQLHLTASSCYECEKQLSAEVIVYCCPEEQCPIYTFGYDVCFDCYFSRLSTNDEQQTNIIQKMK